MYGNHYVQYVNSNGSVNYNDYDYDKGVRPLWGGKREKVREIPEMRVPPSNE